MKLYAVAFQSQIMLIFVPHNHVILQAVIIVIIIIIIIIIIISVLFATFFVNFDC